MGLAQSLIRQPAPLLLDEPSINVMSLIGSETQRRNMVTLMVVRDINIALRHGQHALMLRNGRLLADGAPDG
ncbi:MAG: hypothetical protein GPOALKHO_000320 [Sodalis sp.]|nr:MAG: hypothetical protein GPOALKHO_000320 [Sodalis sp.]